MPEYDIRISVRRTGKGRWPVAEALRLTLSASDALAAFGKAVGTVGMMLSLRERKGDGQP